MDDLIYSFLLQSDYPRASVIFDIDLLGPSAQAGPGMNTPSFVIVDPHIAEVLAVIEVTDAIDGDMLRQVAIETGAYASQLGGKSIQGFVIRVDVRGRTEAEQVQFYRIWPNSTLQQLSSKTFPDLDTLRVARKLVDAGIQAAVVATEGNMLSSTGSTQRQDPVDEPPASRVGMYLPALALVLMILVEGYYLIERGVPFLSVSQSVLAFGAALIFSLPAAIRYLRR